MVLSDEPLTILLPPARNTTEFTLEYQNMPSQDTDQDTHIYTYIHLYTPIRENSISPYTREYQHRQLTFITDHVKNQNRNSDSDTETPIRGHLALYVPMIGIYIYICIYIYIYIYIYVYIYIYIFQNYTGS